MKFNENNLWREKTELLNLMLLNWQEQRFYLNWSLTLKPKSCSCCIYDRFKETLHQDDKLDNFYKTKLGKKNLGSEKNWVKKDLGPRKS